MYTVKFLLYPTVGCNKTRERTALPLKIPNARATLTSNSAAVDGPMPTDLKAYRIFIASPGGLQDERKAFRREVQSYNESEAVHRGVTFIPVGWEETLGGVGRPQSIINEDVRKCDYFLLLLCDRWGSPSSKDGSGYTSGTEEEYSVAMECYEDPELFMRQIVMMFKGVDPKQLSDPGPQLQGVLDFKAQVEQQKRHLFITFDTIESFCELLRRHLGQWLRDHEKGATGRVEEPTPPPSGETLEGMGVETLLEPAAPMTEDSLISGAWSLADEGRLTEAEVEFSKAIVGGNDPEAFLQYGSFLVRGGRLDQAMIMFERARGISEEQDEEAGMASAYGSLGIVLRIRGDLDGAEEMHRKSLKIEKKLGRLGGIANAYGNLGIVLTTRGDLDGAEEMLRKSLEIEEKLGRLEGIAADYSNLGNVLKTRGDLDGAEEMYRKSLEAWQKLGVPNEVARVQRLLDSLQDQNDGSTSSP